MLHEFQDAERNLSQIYCLLLLQQDSRRQEKARDIQATFPLPVRDGIYGDCTNSGFFISSS
jgi:hypothetical protein